LAGRGTHDRRIPAGSGKPPGRTGVEARRAELIELFDLDPSKKMREYSKGSRQKVALVAAFSASADLLLLDEPTSGLDPLMEGAFRQCVRRARDEGAAILLSSHILSEVEKVCDAVTIVRAGRTVERGSLERVRSIVRTRVRAVVAADPSSLRRRPELGDVAVSRDPLGWAVDFTVDPAGMQDAVSAVACLGVRSLTAAPPSLEELFLRHYGAAEVGGDASGAAEGASGDAAGQGVADEPLASGVGRDASGAGRP
jgi:ABC transporter related protein